MKIIITYLRNSIPDDRISDLAVELDIHINFEEVGDVFAKNTNTVGFCCPSRFSVEEPAEKCGISVMGLFQIPNGSPDIHTSSPMSPLWGIPEIIFIIG
jgi:hypothetical protein